MTPLLELGLLALGLYLAHWASDKLGLSSIVGYILLGLTLGPFGMVTVYRSSPVTELLGELGIILLLFYMGLEFSLTRFLETRKEMTLAGLIDLSNYLVGFGIGLVLGLGWLGALFLGGIVYISSSGVIAKLLAERDLIAYPEAERTLGVLVFEDLAMVAILGGLAILTSGGGLLTFVGVAAFLLFYALFLRYGRGLLARLLSREGEALILLALALVVLFSLLAKGLGFPEAVAAFLLGMMLAETPSKDLLEATLRPWYDVAAAVFFLDFALHVDVAGALEQWPAALLLVAATVLGNGASGYLAGRLSGLSQRASVGHGLMLLPRGEFSLVIVGLAAGVEALAPVQGELAGMTSLYVMAMVLLGSLVFRFYDPLTSAIARAVRSPAEREREAERQRELDAVSLD